MGTGSGAFGSQGFQYRPGFGPPERPTHFTGKREKKQIEGRKAKIKAELDMKLAEKSAQEEIDCILRRFLPFARDNLINREKRELVGKRNMSAVERLKVWNKIYDDLQALSETQRRSWFRPEYV